MRTIFLSLVLLTLIVTSSFAQWDWAKGVGISGSTDWRAVSMDETGNFYFSGVSDKLAGSPSRGFVMSKTNDTLKQLVSTKLLGGSTIYRETTNGVDANGNSYMMDRVMSGQTLKRPDGTSFSYTGKYYFVAKYLPNGTMDWSKKLTIDGYSNFQVMADGTVGILTNNINSYYYFGEDSIPAAGNTFIEIKSDGTIGRSAPIGDALIGVPFAQWKEPGKVFVINVTGTTYGPWFYQRGTFDLDAKTFTPEGTPLSVTGMPNTFSMNNNGFPNSPTTVLEPKSGHIFTLMSSYNSDSYLNEKDTIHFKTNSQILDAYVVELDEQMKVVRKIHLTNPVQLAVRDEQVVVTAIVRATGGFGFHSPDTTIKITKTNNNQDGYVVYVMDRNFKYLRHGLIESELQKLFTPNAILIGSGGEVYVSLNNDGGLFFQGQPSTIYSSGTVLAKLTGAPKSTVTENPKSADISVYPNPVTNEFTIAEPGAFRYFLYDLLGNQIASGNGFDKTICNISKTASGTYFLRVNSKGTWISHLIKKIAE